MFMIAAVHHGRLQSFNRLRRSTPADAGNIIL
jgi:hypothetical protein